MNLYVASGKKLENRRLIKVKARFHYEHGMELSLFVLLIFLLLSALKSKKLIKKTNTPFRARSENERLYRIFQTDSSSLILTILKSSPQERRTLDHTHL